MGFPGGSDGKESAQNVGDSGSIPGLQRSPGEENGNPCQYSCLENSMNRGAQSPQAIVHGVAKSQTYVLAYDNAFTKCQHFQHFQGKPFNITVIQVYAQTSNAEEPEVE